MSKGLSLHIALNRVNVEVYGRDGYLNSCLNNARALAGIAVSEGFQEYSILHDVDATKRNFIQALKNMASELTSNDLCLISFSGHGNQIVDESGDEEADGKDELWCFFDGVLTDDELFELWKYFEPGVRIIVIADNCHSGTIIKGLFSQDVLERSLNSNSLEPVPPSIVLISSCKDEQESRDGKRFSSFIDNLLQVWNWGKFTGNYYDFHKALKNISPYLQKPQLTQLGTNTRAILKTKPFKI